MQVGDLVAICSQTIFQSDKDGDVGIVVEVEPKFYTKPKTYHLESFEPVRVDRVRVQWSNGERTYEPANCLKTISEIKKNT